MRKDPYYVAPAFCPMCKKEASFVFLDNYSERLTNGGDRKWSLYECRSCAVQFWLPLTVPKANVYEEDVAYQGKGDVLSKENAPAIVGGYWNARMFLKDFSAKDAAGKRLLDVGCGTGEFCFAARELGYTAEGVDFNQNAIAFARDKLGLENVSAADVYAFLESKKEAYDIITIFEVIEHVPDPGRLLDLAHDALKRGGTIVISTPNRGRHWRHISVRNELWDFPYQHLSRWDMRSFRDFIESHHFSAVRIKEELPTDWFVERLRVIALHLSRKPAFRLQGESHHSRQPSPSRSSCT